MADCPPRRLIGILGGMGPAATIDFMAKILSATPARADQEHVPLIVHDVPQIPDRSASIERGSDAPFLPMLAGIRMLEASGVDLIAIPCNTAHHWYDRLAKACNASILHIADAVVTTLQSPPQKRQRIALLATRGTLSAGIYSARIAQAGLELVVPDEPAQQLIDQAIAGVKGNNLPAASHAAETAARHLIENQGADLLLLACTELPVALAHNPYPAATIDATDALARACVAASLGTASAAARA
jgi:aspartate racemase